MCTAIEFNKYKQYVPLRLFQFCKTNFFINISRSDDPLVSAFIKL